MQKNIHFNGTQFVAGFSSTGREIDLGDILLTPIAIEHIMLRAYKTNALVDEKQSVWKEKKIIKK